MNSIASSDIQRIVTEQLNGRPYSHRQDVDPSVASVITVQDDMRFLPSTFAAVIAQRVLPGTIIVADCAGHVQQPMELTFEVIPSPAGVIMRMPESKTVRVVLVAVKGAVSFSDAVSRAFKQIDPDHRIRALWTLHDDSRPADELCLEHLLDAWRNTPTASLLGAKQLDWQGENLHNVGRFAGRHTVASLVVDGEPDQEQYDSRQDVMSVSLAGALIPLQTLRSWEGIDSWFGTFAESADLCRRICVGGGRVIVVPQARIAHRRARFEGIRTKNGQSAEDGNAGVDSYMSVLDARAKYYYTDVHRSWWPLLWLLSILKALGMSIVCLIRKQPYRACCELALPWKSLLNVRGALRARARLRRQRKVSLRSLSALLASRQQIRQWRDRRDAFFDQRNTTVLSPLEKAHLRARRLRRWGFASGSAVIAFGWVAFTYWNVLRSAVSGASIYTQSLLPTDADLSQLAHAATTFWAYTSGTGISAPSAPWLLMLLVLSVFTGGRVAFAVSLVFFMSAPLMVLSFWALAGVFTRSDAVRCVSALTWFALAVSMGMYRNADVPMMMVMMFLPAAFACSFRAVGIYRTEDLIVPHASVQSAAIAALCFIPVVASEPQLLLPLMLTFLTFLLFVRSDRASLLLIPFPAAFVCAPTLVNAVRFAADGTWRQIFGSVMLPSSSHDGSPVVGNVSEVLFRAFGLSMESDFIGGCVAIVLLAIAVLLAAVSLFLPFVLRASRMMWVASIAGFVTALVSEGVAVSVDEYGPVAGSVLPGVAFAMLGLLSCVCMVAGGAVQRFVMLRQSSSGDVELNHDESSSSTMAVRVGRILLVAIMTISVVFCMFCDYAVFDRTQVKTSDSGLPMVATDYLAQDEGRRILAVRADAVDSVDYSIMRTKRGDLIDSSPAQRVEMVTGRIDDSSATIAEACAQLLSNADADSIISLSELGFGGIYVVRATETEAQEEASDQINSNISASAGTQSVVSADEGTYYRLTVQNASTQRIDDSGLNAAMSSAWRYAWLWCMGIIVAAYCLVAFPRIRRRK